MMCQVPIKGKMENEYYIFFFCISRHVNDKEFSDWRQFIFFVHSYFQRWEIVALSFLTWVNLTRINSKFFSYLEQQSLLIFYGRASQHVKISSQRNLNVPYEMYDNLAVIFSTVEVIICHAGIIFVSW